MWCWCCEVLSQSDNRCSIFWNMFLLCLVYTPTTQRHSFVNLSTCYEQTFMHTHKHDNPCQSDASKRVLTLILELNSYVIHLLSILFFPSSDPALEIGILDIFGFEELQRNGFEQVGQRRLLLDSSEFQRYASMSSPSFPPAKCIHDIPWLASLAEKAALSCWHFSE